MRNLLKTNTKLAALFIAVLFTGSILVLQSCNNKDPEPTKPEITSVSPTSALPGGTVTINGKNFKDGTSGVSVTFEGSSATLTSATATSIECIVPQLDAGPADIIVTVDGQVSAAYTNFEVLGTIQVTGFSPARGRFDTLVTISGENFGSSASEVTVTVNDKEQEITEINDTEITIKLAKKTWSGPVKVTRGTSSASADEEFLYIDSYRSETIDENRDLYDVVITDEGNILVAIINNPIYGIYEYSPEGVIVDTFMQNYLPIGLFLADDGLLYVADDRQYVLSLDMDDEIVDTIVDLTSTSMYPYHIIGDNNGTLYATTGSAHNIIKINISEGTYEILFSDPEQHGTNGLCFYDGKLYFSTGTRLMSMDLDGKNLTVIIPISDGFSFGQCGITVDSKNVLYTGERDSDAIHKLVNNKLEKVIDINNDGITGLCADEENNLFVVGYAVDVPNLIKVLVE